VVIVVAVVIWITGVTVTADVTVTIFSEDLAELGPGVFRQ
jgi:hypothetical protein